MIPFLPDDGLLARAFNTSNMWPTLKDVRTLGYIWFQIEVLANNWGKPNPDEPRDCRKPEPGRQEGQLKSEGRGFESFSGQAIFLLENFLKHNF